MTPQESIDLVRAISPGTPTQMVGIRPGEKLHEVLIPETDTSTILDFPDRTVVSAPQDAGVAEHHLGRGGRPVPQGFKFSSDNNRNRVEGETIGVAVSPADGAARSMRGRSAAGAPSGWRSRRRR